MHTHPVSVATSIANNTPITALSGIVVLLLIILVHGLVVAFAEHFSLSSVESVQFEAKQFRVELSQGRLQLYFCLRVPIPTGVVTVEPNDYYRAFMCIHYGIYQSLNLLAEIPVENKQLLPLLPHCCYRQFPSIHPYTPPLYLLCG